jgi:CHAT domain-containing protein
LCSSQKAEGKSFKFYRNSIKVLQQDAMSYGFYFRELEKHLNGINTVYCSADGIYHQINLATLLNPDTKKYVAEEKLIRAVPSTSWIVQKEHKEPRLVQSTFFAHPTYGEATASAKTDLTRSLDLDNIADLPGTEVELNELTALMKESQIKYTSYEGATATEESIKKIQSPQVLHIATHGFFLPQSQSKEKFENPLLRSGLLLAGCQKNQVSNDSREDGVLTAFEASTLPLYQTSLVVMSACETGLGEVKNGEGVYGLQRAFFMAGAQQLLMSLWKVDDQATQQFMVAFYKEWINSQSSSKAFRQAQLAVREKYPEPFYWGAFVLNGY